MELHGTVWVVYLFGCVLLTLGVQALQHLALIQLPERIHPGTKGFSPPESTPAQISCFLCGLPALLYLDQARLSVSSLELPPCVKVSAAQEPLSAHFHAPPAQVAASLVRANVDPGAAPGQVK